MSVLGFAAGKNASLQSLLTKSPAGEPPEPPVKSLGDLASVLRSSLPNGVMASLPQHLKSLLSEKGVPFPTGPEALSQQRTVAQLEQKLKNGGGDDTELANLRLQQAMQDKQRLLQTLSNISKTQHDTAKSIIQNIR